MVDVRTPSDDGPQPRLRLRFALYTGIVLLATGLAISWLVDREVAQRAGRTVQAQARAVALTNLRHALRPSDFVRPVSPARRATLDSLFRTSIIVPGAVGGRLYARDGTITYSTLHTRIGQPTRHPKVLGAVLAGKMTQRVTTITTWRGRKNVKVLQILAPVQGTPSSRPIGVIRVDQDYRAAVVGTGDAQTRLALILATALLALFVSLLPIMNRLTRQLETRTRRLGELAEERGKLLEAERAARADAEAAQRLLADQNDRLRELDRLKDEFISLVSHEFRTPLTSIRGYVELLQDDRALSSDQRRFLTVVDRNATRLLDLVSDLLFLAQVDAGRMTFELRPVDLETVVLECVESCLPTARAKRIDLRAQTERLPALDGDPARLAQVLDNLVSNALKFTPVGGRVDVRVTAADDSAVIEVEDTGEGLPAEEQDRLFERFFRSSRAAEAAVPGTGLGLAIAKTIVERHGGRIALESAVGTGTTVRVELPLLQRQQAAA